MTPRLTYRIDDHDLTVTIEVTGDDALDFEEFSRLCNSIDSEMSSDQWSVYRGVLVGFAPEHFRGWDPRQTAPISIWIDGQHDTGAAEELCSLMLVGSAPPTREALLGLMIGWECDARTRELALTWLLPQIELADPESDERADP